MIAAFENHAMAFKQLDHFLFPIKELTHNKSVVVFTAHDEMLVNTLKKKYGSNHNIVVFGDVNATVDNVHYLNHIHYNSFVACNQIALLVVTNTDNIRYHDSIGRLALYCINPLSLKNITLHNKLKLILCINESVRTKLLITTPTIHKIKYKVKVTDNFVEL
jgi:hypothetical protein